MDGGIEREGIKGFRGDIDMFGDVNGGGVGGGGGGKKEGKEKRNQGRNVLHRDFSQ